MQGLAIFFNLGFSELAKKYILLYVPVILIISPLFFLYVKTISQQRVFKYHFKDIVHFIPSISVFVIILVLHLFYINLDTDTELYKDIYSFYWSVIMFSITILFPLQNVFYIISITIAYRKHKKKIKEIFSYELGINLKWLQLFILGYVLFVLTIIITELSKYYFYNLSVEFLTTIYLLYSGYYTLRQEGIYQLEKQNLVLKEIVKERNLKTNNYIQNEEKYQGSALKDEQRIQDIKTKLLKELEIEKPYLNPKLSIYDIAEKLDINYKYLSQVINQELNMSFITFVNNYRTKEAKSLLLKPDYQQYTIEAISLMAGFNSKSTFNTFFKKEIGFTPSIYRKQNL